MKVLLGLSFLASTAQAFVNTVPFVALSSHERTFLPSLTPHGAASVFTASNEQLTFSSPSGPDEICQIDTVVWLNVEGLHFSDLKSLKPSTTLGAAVRAEGSKAVVKPYVPASIGLGARSPLGEFLQAFVHTCGGAVQDPESTEEYRPSEGRRPDRVEKILRVDRLTGLEGIGLVGEEEKAYRASVAAALNDRIETHIAGLPSASYVVLVTAFASPSKAFLRPDAAPAVAAASHSELRRRQFLDDPFVGTGNDLKKGGSSDNGSSIFAVKDTDGLLKRYVFFTPNTTFALLVTLLLFIPILILSTQALTSTATVHGLESKMVGSTNVEGSGK